MQKSIPCMMFRGGTSKGLYFLASDLPSDETERSRALLRIMGSPDQRQIDGVGGAHPLTSKVAIIGKSQRPGIDVDYLFVQVAVAEARTTTAQNCGNILAGVGQFAIEKGLVAAQDGETIVTVYMENTQGLARQRILTPGGKVQYEGEASMDGVPGTHAPVMIEFVDVAGSSCGALFPSGNHADEIDGLPVTLVDNGMPVAIMSASSLGLRGDESVAELEGDRKLKERVEAIRLKAGPLMNLGDVRDQTVPKMTIVSPPRHGGLLNTRSFIPHRVHEAVGALAGASIAVAAIMPGAVGHEMALIPEGKRKLCLVEHPSGASPVEVEMSDDPAQLQPVGTAIMRTARLLFSGTVYYLD